MNIIIISFINILLSIDNIFTVIKSELNLIINFKKHNLFYKIVEIMLDCRKGFIKVKP